ncbi:hypothetical protein [Streptomyces sp. HUAS ZL42]|uniref:hypothetical protein n=1 Tax=Streptomyces sp. HUAS ZL42 TaxID=3231715 RepID=UPI00345EE99B
MADRVRAHTRAFRDCPAAPVTGAGLPTALGGRLYLLAEGAMVTAGITDGTGPAAEAREAVRLLLRAR